MPNTTLETQRQRRRTGSVPQTSRAQYQPSHTYSSFYGGHSFTPGGTSFARVLPSSATPDPYNLDAYTLSRAQEWQRKGYNLPVNPMTGLPVMPDDHQYGDFMEYDKQRQVYGSKERGSPLEPWHTKPGTQLWQAPSHLTTHTQPNVDISGGAPDLTPEARSDMYWKGIPVPQEPRLFEMQFPDYGEPNDFMRRGLMREFNKAHSDAATKRHSFETLDEYDKWFKNILQQVDGSALIAGHVMKDYYEKYMPSNVRSEYDAFKQKRDIRANIQQGRQLLDEEGFKEKYEVAPDGSFVERKIEEPEKDPVDEMLRRREQVEEYLRRAGLDDKFRPGVKPGAYEEIEDPNAGRLIPPRPGTPGTQSKAGAPTLKPAEVQTLRAVRQRAAAGDPRAQAQLERFENLINLIP